MSIMNLNLSVFTDGRSVIPWLFLPGAAEGISAEVYTRKPIGVEASNSLL